METLLHTVATLVTKHLFTQLSVLVQNGMRLLNVKVGLLLLTLCSVKVS